jgi:hypothetical protein
LRALPGQKSGLCQIVVSPPRKRHQESPLAGNKGFARIIKKKIAFLEPTLKIATQIPQNFRANIRITTADNERFDAIFRCRLINRSEREASPRPGAFQPRVCHFLHRHDSNRPRVARSAKGASRQRYMEWNN